MVTFGKRLKKSRNKIGLTQDKVAEIIGIDDTTISKYETDNSEPDRVNLLKLCDLYGVSTDYLYGRENREVVLNENAELDRRVSVIMERINKIDDEKELDFTLEVLKRLLGGQK